jgi:uncharacterized protein
MSKEELKAKIKQAIERDQDQDAIKKVSLFGSFLHGEAETESDVDLLVELNPNIPVGLFKYVSIQRRLGESIGKEVDLVTPEALSRHFRDRVLAEAEIIYEG